MNARRTAVALVAAVGLLVGGCSTYDPSPEERLTRLDKLYSQGKAAATAMRSRGVDPTDKTCQTSYIAAGLEDQDRITDEVGARDVDEDTAWQKQRKTAYINGCMNRGNPASPSPTFGP